MPARDTPPRQETTPIPGAPAPRERFGLPDQRTLVGWLFSFRVVVATVLLVRAAYIWPQIGGDSLFIIFVILLALSATAFGIFLVQIRQVTPGPASYLTQALADLAVVTALVRVAGEASTALAALYVVVIAVYALLLPAWASVLVAAAAGVSYVVTQLLANANELPAGLWGQLVVFGFVFVLVAILAQRLQRQARERDQMATELSRVRFEAGEILRSIKTGVITVDGTGSLAFANPAAERLLAIDMATTAGHPILDRLRTMAPELHDAVVTGIRRGERVVRGEGTVTRPDGRRFPIGLSTTTFERSSDTVPAVTALFTDLSDLKQLQELHLRAERLEAVAALSASLAHEIRNPLASIRSSVEQLAASAQADDDERELGRLIMRESDRLSRLLGEFLDFSRVRASNFSAVDLHEVALETARLVEGHPDCGGSVLEVLGERTPIEADEDLVHRIVSNLLLNAAQACKGAGRIVVTVGPADPAGIPRGAQLRDPVQLVVEDDGPGIDSDLRQRLFQPFVSRRPGGSGLGLAIVQRAVEAHRGLVLVASIPGQGARFTVYLPTRPFREETA
jgi:two-component system sensor histidine kinase PilS (NtrC family)